MSQWAVFHGDALELLRTLPDCCVDSVVTDPPAGIEFMGRHWDSNKGGSKQWIAWLTEITRECLRVLKPGGHALFWALPRTSHWTATAVEDGGFELRDVITHHFGSGMPKSHDASKAVDKRLDTTAQRQVYATYTAGGKRARARRRRAARTASASRTARPSSSSARSAARPRRGGGTVSGPGSSRNSTGSSRASPGRHARGQPPVATASAP
jgi:site-specific DNA-methyltransferase (adenine-specific)